MAGEVKQEIEQKIAHVLAGRSLEASEVALERPADLNHGDYSTNAALILAKREGRSALAIAEELAAALMAERPPAVDRVTAVAPGFVNFSLTPEFYQQSLGEIMAAGRDYGRGVILKGQKILIEYTNPNPFKEFHIGHLMNNAIGESLSRLFEFCGATVVRANYQGDIGLHIAKTIWGLLQGADHYPQTVAALGAAYTLGVARFEDDMAAKEAIIAINRQLYDGSNETVNKIYQQGRALSLRSLEEIYQRLGTKFDHYFFESEVWRHGKELVEGHLADGVFERSDGAIVFRGEKFGLHTRVFINRDGLPTYEGKELGLNHRKFEVLPDLDLSYVVAANEQKDYFRVVLQALQMIAPAITLKTRHLAYGMLRFASGKMSSRLGNVVAAETLLKDIEKAVALKMAEEKVPIPEREAVVQAVALGAIKYSILRQGIGRDIIFDVEKSISLLGDSGPYLQYAHARARSVLARAAADGLAARLGEVAAAPETLERLLPRFPEVVARAYLDLSPSHLTTYLTQLAATFNAYYASNQIISLNDPRSPSRLALVAAFATVMQNGLYLLGIPAPEKM